MNIKRLFNGLAPEAMTGKQVFDTLELYARKVSNGNVATIVMQFYDEEKDVVALKGVDFCIEDKYNYKLFEDIKR